MIALQEALDGKLVERQAREIGICPVREELYGQCFGESRSITLLLEIDRSGRLVDTIQLVLNGLVVAMCISLLLMFTELELILSEDSSSPIYLLNGDVFFFFFFELALESNINI